MVNKKQIIMNYQKKTNNELKCGSKVCKLVPANGCLAKEKNIDKKTCSFDTKKQNGDGKKDII